MSVSVSESVPVPVPVPVPVYIYIYKEMMSIPRTASSQTSLSPGCVVKGDKQRKVPKYEKPIEVIPANI